MIAMKREVAALPKGIAGFPWSECQEGWPKNGSPPLCDGFLFMTGQTQEPDDKSLYKHIVCQRAETRALSVFAYRKKVRRAAHYFIGRQDTHGRVYSHRLSYLLH